MKLIGVLSMTYKIEFPMKNKSMIVYDGLSFNSIALAEEFVLDPMNSWLSEHGVVNIIIIEKKIVYRIDKEKTQ